jgi:hypothetical protein
MRVLICLAKVYAPTICEPRAFINLKSGLPMSFTKKETTHIEGLVNIKP